MKVFLFALIFFLIGAFFIVSENNLHLNSQKNIDLFIDLYFKWVDGVIENGKTVSSYVIKMEWLPEEGK